MRPQVGRGGPGPAEPNLGPWRGCSTRAGSAWQSTGGSGGRLSVCLGSCTPAAKPLGSSEPGYCIRASSVSITPSEREGSPPASWGSRTRGAAALQTGRVGEALSDQTAECFGVHEHPMQSMRFLCLWVETGFSEGRSRPACSARPCRHDGMRKRGEMWKCRDLGWTPKDYAHLDQILKIYL